ncbi:protein-L-isoaspartate O-methyltransferase family protein [Acidithiobacillus ferriphilus]|uniref:protein-L-isoaspartate O-methyltransferase family protein n=1 Tax=Acidithiobacillus TaxID=119977 RepID=UPI001C074E77|nr:MULTISPECIES: protein-L-isoaspartate O-methyltransferase [Acidithiobacillus]MBU2848013.1 protein-L-isoaspartate O-methyltransferase [Acidithiobacillus ferriphilus]MDA8246291.1 protein-L-isoaspartate O-methyltransferase [Acidithiobacillus sp.]MEB8536259.1 protein-L-isoaspartate O-methyltransferase [Acidithiobacillus ferriphilus]
MDFDALRRTMIDTQIRTWDVLDPRVLATVAQVKREFFVPTPYRHLAFADFTLPLGHSEIMWTPKMEARVLQELDLHEQDRVLEIGTGSGYLTALMAQLAGMVHSVEDRAELSRTAEGRLRVQGVHNAHLHVGDGSTGWADNAPYDAICITGSLPVLPEVFKEQLSVGGRLIAILGTGPAMRVRRIFHSQPGIFEYSELFETEIPPLRHKPLPARFVF